MKTVVLPFMVGQQSDRGQDYQVFGHQSLLAT